MNNYKSLNSAFTIDRTSSRSYHTRNIKFVALQAAVSYFLLSSSLLSRTPSSSSTFVRAAFIHTSSSHSRKGTLSPINKRGIPSPISPILSTCTTSTIMNSSRTTNADHTTLSSTNDDKDPLALRNLPSPLILGSGSFTRKLILKEMKIPFLLKVKSIPEESIGVHHREEGGRKGAMDLVSMLALAKAEALIHALLECNTDLKQNDDNDGIVPVEKNEEDINNKNSMVLPSASSSTTTSMNNQDGWIVLTADQVVTHKEKILEKPKDITEAKQFVSSYATSPPSTVGAVVLTHIPSMIQVSGVDTAQINFRTSIGEKNDDDGLDIIDRLIELKEPVMSCAGGLMVEHPLVREHLEGIDGTEDSVMGLSKGLVLKLLDEMREELDKSQ